MPALRSAIVRVGLGTRPLNSGVMRMNSGTATVRRLKPEDAEAFNVAVTSVAGERQYLAAVDGFPLEATKAFLRDIESAHHPAVVAIANGHIIGWCDIIPRPGVGFSHVGTLGMGVMKQWRRQGVGRKLVEECLALARAANLEKVELAVYADNAPAIHLYENMGFTHEGRKRDSRKLDGRYQDEMLMALRL